MAQNTKSNGFFMCAIVAKNASHTLPRLPASPCRPNDVTRKHGIMEARKPIHLLPNILDTLMVLEIADIEIKPGTASQFEQAVAEAAPLFEAARGCVSMKLRRCVEQADRYQLHVQWRTLEDHTVHFRASAAFQEWRRLAGPFFATPPAVTHWGAAPVGF
jgi:heme-degrading monooxygenase HmoA